MDEQLGAEIEAVSRAAAERLRRPYADFDPGVTQAGDDARRRAISLGLAGTAPGLLVLARRRAASPSRCPARRAELQGLWPRALETDAFRALLGARCVRPAGASCVSSASASRRSPQALAAAGGDGDGVEVTICARDFEIHVDLVVEPGAESRADELEAALRPGIEQWLFSRDEQPIEEHVLALLRARG